MRILLLTLYYPPLNTIAALRIKAFEKYLIQQGHGVDVITRYYDKKQQEGKSMFLGREAPENFNESYIKKENVIYTNFDAQNSKSIFSKKLPPLIRGIYNYLQVDIFHYGWVKYVFEAFEKELKTNTYDFVIASYGPPIVMRMGKEITKNYGIPTIVDFRDSFIDEKDSFYQLFMKKMVQQQTLKKASGFIFATKGMHDFFAKHASKQLRNIPACVVYNGVEDDDNVHFPHLDDADTVLRFDILKATNSFLLLHTGTLYSGQNSSFFLSGLELFNKKYNTTGIAVFLGLAENESTNELNYPFVHLLPKVKHSTTLYLQKQASALLLPIWDGRYTGFSGKTLEYIYSGNFIITSPNPQPDLKEFLTISPNVFIAEDQTAFASVLEQLNSNTLLKRNLKENQQLYRSYWIKKMISFLVDFKQRGFPKQNL